MLIVRSVILASSLAVLSSLVACAPVYTGMIANTGVIATPVMTYAVPTVSTMVMAPVYGTTPMVASFGSTPMVASYGSTPMVATYGGAPMVSVAPAPMMVSARPVIWP
jgi:hypothetical protein